mgnify:CR=1 FL=1
MPGTFNGKTLVISATPTAGAKIVDAGAATNVAGITISGDTMYSVKTSGKVTTLYKTPDYSKRRCTGCWQLKPVWDILH